MWWTASVRQKTDDSHADSFDCPQQRGCLRGRSLRQQVYNADRIKYPMKRKSWQPGGGEAAHGELRGKDSGERISWDEADLRDRRAEARLRAVRPGRRHLQRLALGPGSAMFPVIGGAVYNTECESFGCWAFKRKHWACTPTATTPDLMMAPDKYDLPNADTIVLYGCNPAWSQHSSMYWLKNAQKAGSTSCSSAPTTTPPPPPWTPAGSACAPAPTRPSCWLCLRDGAARRGARRHHRLGLREQRTVGFTPETMPADATTDGTSATICWGDNTPKDAGMGKICGTG